MKGASGWKHTPEARAKIAASNRAHWADPVKRAEISQATKARMADPAVRQRIKDGMRAAVRLPDDLRSLKTAWDGASVAARSTFINELLLPACSASAFQTHDRNER